MNVIQKAHELANALQESEELSKLRDLETQLLNQNIVDEESDLYQEYTAALQQFTNLLEAIKYILTNSYDGKLGHQNGCGQCCKNRKTSL